MLKRNWSLKILSVLIALAMWVFVVGQEKSEITLRAPIEISNIPADAMVLEDSPSEVDARVFGPRTLIRRMALERLSKNVDMTGLGMGSHVFQVVPEDLRLPPGVKALRISPEAFSLTLVKRMVREAPVRPVFKGQPAQGLEVVEVKFKPEKVVVTGSQDDMANLDWIWTTPIDLNERAQSFSLPASLRQPRGRSVRLSRQEVEATVTLAAVPPPAPAPAPAKKHN
jgi:YbbR domain-containing protein